MAQICLCLGRLRHPSHSSVVKKPENIEAWLAELGDPSADRDYQPGHARMLALLDGMVCHRPKLRIRIAGTNGKGSTAFMLAAALQSIGLKVGLYTSPHILEFNERIRINGIPVDNDELLAGLARIMPLARRAGASYFETATALALDQFSRASVDVEILEAGVGARLDATTAIAADMALITPIALDHQNWLGDTITQIADEKAHAMQGCRISISAPQCNAAAGVLRNVCPDILFCDRDSWEKLAAPGLHQQINASLAWTAVQQLSRMLLSPDQTDARKTDLTTARHAIARCSVPGRLQHLRMGQADVWLDAAHNRHAVEALLPSLQQLADPFDTILVFTREDRSLADCLSLFAPYAGRIISNDQIPQQELSPAKTLQAEIDRNKQGKFLVLGSFTTVAAILR